MAGGIKTFLIQYQLSVYSSNTRTCRMGLFETYRQSLFITSCMSQFTQK